MNLPQDQELLQEAVKAAARAYAPYSRFPVGAALLTQSGELFTGCNVENASYGLTICAERVAVFRAIADGQSRFRTLALSSPGAVSPCGACRQVLHEFSPELEVLIGDATGQLIQRLSLQTLLPEAFQADSTPSIGP